MSPPRPPRLPTATSPSSSCSKLLPACFPAADETPCSTSLHTSKAVSTPLEHRPQYSAPSKLLPPLLPATPPACLLHSCLYIDTLYVQPGLVAWHAQRSAVDKKRLAVTITQHHTSWVSLSCGVLEWQPLAGGILPLSLPVLAGSGPGAGFACRRSRAGIHSHGPRGCATSTTRSWAPMCSSTRSPVSRS